MKHISPEAFKEVLEAEQDNESIDFINVCTPAEYQEKHISGVRSVPLDQLEQRIDEFKDKKTIYVHCRSGSRGRQALERLAKMGVSATLVNVEGGIIAWERAGFRVHSTTNRMPIMRQVLTVAGSLLVLFSLLAVFIHPLFVLGTLGVGIGLLVAGITGWCGMALLLSRMPWNR